MRGYSLFDNEDPPRSGILTPRGDRPKPDAEALRNGSDVERLRSCFNYRGEFNLQAPYLIVTVLRGGMWRRFADDHTWEEYRYERLDDFVKAKPPGGLGRSNGTVELRAIIAPYAKKDVTEDEEVRALALEALRLIDEEQRRGRTRSEAGALGGRGKKATHDMPSFHHESPTGVLRRLKRDRPDLAALVVAGEMSADAAAKEAGFRKHRVQVQVTPAGFLKAARKHLSEAERHELKEAL